MGSATVALNASGTPTASQLYAPYGGVRYANGVMPTDYGFTGQRADVTTGLDDYGARYYDPSIGQFTSADTVLDGLNRYGYVGGNPISRVDPSGHILVEFDPGQFGGRAQGPEGPWSSGRTTGGDTGGGPPIHFPVSEPLHAEDVVYNTLYNISPELVMVRNADGSTTWIMPGDPDPNPSHPGRWAAQQQPAEPNEFTGPGRVDWNNQFALASGNNGNNGNNGGSNNGGGGGHGGGSGNGGKGSIPPPPPPPTPSRPINPVTGRPMSFPEFGKLIGWGKNLPGKVDGSQVAVDRMIVLMNNPSEVDAIRDAGVTRQMAREWYELYAWNSTWRRTNPTAAGRAVLMWYLYLVL